MGCISEFGGHLFGPPVRVYYSQKQRDQPTHIWRCTRCGREIEGKETAKWNPFRPVGRRLYS